MALTNWALWNYVRSKNPNFASHTSKGTAEMFTERGFDQLAQFDSSILNDFFSLSLRVFLQKIDVAEVKDLLENQDFGESYNTPYGGYVQRMSINSVKPISPGYKGLQNGDSPDPFVVRKPVTNERFWTQNFDYASLITMPDTALYKNMFVSETGMSDYLGGVMKALQNGYTLQKYTNKLEALNAGIHSTNFPLKNTQEYTTLYEMDGTGSATSDELIGLVRMIRDIVDTMVFNPATSAFNAYGFESTQNKDNLRLLARPKLFNELATISRLNSPEDMSLPIKVVKVPDFGGLTPYLNDMDISTFPAGSIHVGTATESPTYATYKAATASTAEIGGFTTEIEEGAPNYSFDKIYDDLGEMIAYAAYIPAGYASVGGTPTTDPMTLYIPTDLMPLSDPNYNVIAVIADKGYIFENQQNPYQVEPIRNPRGLYTNFWASSPNNGIVVDHIKNIVLIKQSEG